MHRVGGNIEGVSSCAHGPVLVQVNVLVFEKENLEDLPTYDQIYASDIVRSMYIRTHVLVCAFQCICMLYATMFQYASCLCMYMHAVLLYTMLLCGSCLL